VTAHRPESWFLPFFNLDKDVREYPQPHGLIERGMPSRVVQTIRDLRQEFASQWDLSNCTVIVPAWAARLKKRHPRMRIEPEGDPGSDNPTSGYYVDGHGIRAHLWVVVGPRQLIFDPTACQFEEGNDVALPYPKPGISLDRYRKDGCRFIDLR
jgi:hypothetical protein